MLLEHVSQLNFRNLVTPRVELAPGLTVLTGANGAGKSNFLAACYLALTGDLPYGRIADAIAHGQEGAFVGARLQHDEGESLIEIGLGPGKRSIRLDGNTIRAEQVATVAAAVLMTPEDAELVHGSPARRRAFLDSLLSRLSLRYARLAAEYQRVLQQRNAMLRSGWFDASLDTWTERLVSVGDEIEQLRARATVRLRELAAAAYREVASSAERNLLEFELASAGRAPLGQALEESRAEERARGLTVVGPHRDDLLLRLGGHSVQAFGSRGEARTVALALKVAEFRLLAERHREEPVLLLDDFTAELDPDRRAFLLALAERTPQTVASGTEAPGGTVSARVLHVVDGRIGA